IAADLADRLLVILGIAVLVASIGMVIDQESSRRLRSARRWVIPSLRRRVAVGRFFFACWSVAFFGIAIGYVVHTQSTSVWDSVALMRRLRSEEHTSELQ